jgi:hypothetical protein
VIDVDELTRLCVGLRARGVVTDEALVQRVESELPRYRKFLCDPRPQHPPAELAGRLPLLGWLIYEASWTAVQRVVPAFEWLDEAGRAPNRELAVLIERLADVGRRLPWPEFAPRALGAIRAQALVESKRDTAEGFDRAWLLHQEARKRYVEFRECHRAAGTGSPEVLGLDETFIQLALAETGTACRTSERVISRWTEELARDRPMWTDADGTRWTQRIARQLVEAIGQGEAALAVAARVEGDHGLVHDVTAERMALVTAFQNPGIMTARAALLYYALTPELAEIGRKPYFAATWDDERAEVLRRFTSAYRAIERPVRGPDNRPRRMHPDHDRSLIHLRLNVALLVPGHDLPSALDFAPCLRRSRLDDAAVEELSAWMRETGSDANVIGSATKHGFLRSVVQCRRLAGAGSGYHEWRERWPDLDRYRAERHRERQVHEALAATRP